MSEQSKEILIGHYHGKGSKGVNTEENVFFYI